MRIYQKLEDTHVIVTTETEWNPSERNGIPVRNMVIDNATIAMYRPFLAAERAKREAERNGAAQQYTESTEKRG